MEVYKHLKARGLSVRVAPAPRVEHACCGTSVLVPVEIIDDVRAELEHMDGMGIERVVYVEGAIDSKRDRFC